MMEKLTHIWVPEGAPRKTICASVSRNWWFKFRADIDDSTYFEYDEYLYEWGLHSTEGSRPANQYYGNGGYLIFDGDYALWTGTIQFTEKWLPFFRRNCWLSGCPIECTLQERLEAIQRLPQDAALVLEREFERDVLTRRERLELLELRLTMPREFWPKRWLDEETG